MWSQQCACRRRRHRYFSCRLQRCYRAVVNFIECTHLRRGVFHTRLAVVGKLQHTQDLTVFLGFTKAKHGAGVLDDPLDLRQRRRRINRNDNGTGGPNGVVEKHPLVARIGHQRNAITMLHTSVEQPLGHRINLVQKLLAGHRDPGVVFGRVNISAFGWAFTASMVRVNSVWPGSMVYFAGLKASRTVLLGGYAPFHLLSGQLYSPPRVSPKSDVLVRDDARIPGVHAGAVN